MPLYTYPFGAGKDDLSVSAYMGIDFPLMTAEASYVSSLLPISPFPHFPFLISSLVLFGNTQFFWQFPIPVRVLRSRDLQMSLASCSEHLPEL